MAICLYERYIRVPDLPGDFLSINDGLIGCGWRKRLKILCLNKAVARCFFDIESGFDPLFVSEIQLSNSLNNFTLQDAQYRRTLWIRYYTNGRVIVACHIPWGLYGG